MVIDILLSDFNVVESVNIKPLTKFEFLTKRFVRRQTLVNEQKIFIFRGEIRFVVSTLTHAFAITCRSYKNSSFHEQSSKERILEIGIIEGGGWNNVCKSEIFQEALLKFLFSNGDNNDTMQNFVDEYTTDHDIVFVLFGSNFQRSLESKQCKIGLPTHFIQSETNKYSFDGRCQLTTSMLIDMVQRTFHKKDFNLQHHVIQKAKKFLETLKSLSLEQFNANNGPYIEDELQDLEKEVDNQTIDDYLHSYEYQSSKYGKIKYVVDDSTNINLNFGQMCLAVNLFTELWFLEAVNYYFQQVNQCLNIMFEIPLFVANSNRFVYDRLQLISNYLVTYKIETYKEYTSNVYTDWLLEAFTNFDKLTKLQTHSLVTETFTNPNCINIDLSGVNNIPNCNDMYFVVNMKTKEAFTLYYKPDEELGLEDNLKSVSFIESLEFVEEAMKELPRLVFVALSHKKQLIKYVITIVSIETFQHFLQTETYRGEYVLLDYKTAHDIPSENYPYTLPFYFNKKTLFK